MKKIIKLSIFSLIIFIAGIFIMPTKGESVSSDFCIGLKDNRITSKVRGDVNLDGFVTNRDEQLINQILAQYQLDLSEQALSNADVDRDNSVGPSDSMLVSKIVSNFENYRIDGANEIKIGEKIKLETYIKSNMNTTETITWTSSSDNIATVSSDGTVTAISKGKVTIKAENKKDNASDEVVLYVVPEYGDISKNQDGSIIAKLSLSTLYITGKGEMKDFDDFSRWVDFDVKKVVIENGITSIGNNAFNKYEKLVEVEIPESITKIGDRAFSFCSAIKNFNIPNKVTNIGEMAFLGCSNFIVARNSYVETYLKNDGNSYKYDIKYAIPSFQGNMKYTGKEIIPSMVLRDGNVILNNGDDYEFEYSNNVNVGNSVVTIRGKGDYVGNQIASFNITPKDLSECMVDDLPDYVYTNSSITPDVNVKYKDENEYYIYLVKNTDYTLEYEDNINVGLATVTIKGKGNYEGTITKKFDILAKNISNAVIYNIIDKTYTGNDLKQELTVKLNGIVLRNNTDYEITYIDNRNVGIATIVITGKGNYTGTVNKTFRILPRNISKYTISKISDQTYTGKEIKPSITIKNGNITLKNGVDYTISYKNNKNPGKGTIVIKGKGNYTGTINKTFNIKVRKVTGLKASSQNTTSIKLSWSKATGVSKYQLYKYNSSKKKWEKVATTSKTSYTVKKLKAGTTYKFRVRAYKTISKKNYYGSYSSTLSTATRTSTPKISKITSKSKKATLNWKKVSGASGYEIYMATNKKGKYSKVKTVSSKTVKYTKSSLKNKKTYYFKIRTYKKVSGKKIYSSYSTIKSIRVK